MTDSYDNPERDISYPRDLDALQRGPDGQYPPNYHPNPQYQPPPRNMAEAADIRSRLATNLRASIEEAHNLSTFYDNFAQTLELCLSQLETKK